MPLLVESIIYHVEVTIDTALAQFSNYLENTFSATKSCLKKYKQFSLVRLCTPQCLGLLETVIASVTPKNLLALRQLFTIPRVRLHTQNSSLWI